MNKTIVKIYMNIFVKIFLICPWILPRWEVWIGFILLRMDQWWSVVNTVTNLRVP